jgi:hypothetical protein
MKEVKIKKGKHLSNMATKPMFGKRHILTAEVIFKESCMYEIDPQDQKDWNKLFGMSFGFCPPVKQFMMHYNSARFGWRYNTLKKVIEVTPYLYDKGKRLYAEILGMKPAELNIGEKYLMSIIPMDNEVTYEILDAFGNVIFRETIHQAVPSLRGWFAPPYFGGNQKAPHNIYIGLEVF